MKTLISLLLGFLLTLLITETTLCQNPATVKKKSSTETKKDVPKKSSTQKSATNTTKPIPKKSSNPKAVKPVAPKNAGVKKDTSHKPPVANDPPKRKQLKAGPNGEKIVTNQKGERYYINKNGNKVYVD